MLLNDFFSYKVLEQSDDAIIATVRFNKEHAIYKGHFPGMPITPGVCQVQMVQEILTDTFSATHSLRSAKDIKFLNFINPSELESLQLELSLSIKDDNYLAVKCLLCKDGVNYLKMRAVFARK